MWQIIGPIDNPLQGYAGIQGGGLVKFFNNILRLLIIIGGVWALLNIIMAGYGFLSTADDPKRMIAAWGKIWQSLVGLLFILGSFVLAMIFGYLLFGEAMAILNPTLYGPGTP